jgi:hypothetical protein
MDTNRLVDMASAMCYELFLSEDIWRPFSFKKRPQRGEIFNFLISKGQSLTEDFLKEELVSLNFVDILNVLRKRLEDAKNEFEYYEWHARASLVEGMVVSGILDRFWYTRIFKDFDKFLATIKDVTHYSSTFDSEKIIHSFTERFQTTSTFLPYDKILEGSTFLFKSSEYARNKVINQDRYLNFFEKNIPEGALNMHLKEKDKVEKLIKTTIYLLKIE